MNNSEDFKIIKSIFSKYILHNPVNRVLMFPVLVMMIIAKYLEVLGASQTKEISAMINSNSRDNYQVFKYSLITLLGVFLVEMQSFLICKAGQVGYRMSNKDTYKYFLSLEPDEFNSIGKGEIQNTISRKSQAVQDMIDVFTLNFFPTFLTIIFVSYEAFKGLGFVSVMIINISMIIYSITTIKITTWRNKMRKNLIIAQNKTCNILMDGLCNFETIFSCDTEDIEIQKYNNSLKHIEMHSTSISRSLYILNLVQRTIWSVMSISIIIYNIFYNKKSITSENFVFLVYITSIIIKSLDNLGFMYGKFQAALINAKMTNLASRNSKNDGYRTIYKLNKSLNVNKITIKYGDKKIIENASFTINKGDKVAIIGKNGTGKSSIVKSFVKLIKSEGDFEIDGINTKNCTDSSFKSLISYIPQNNLLFDGSVMENIKYGNHKLYDEEVYNASKELGIHDSIMKMEHGYYTSVGEQGKNLSGGERQKIIILRTILRQSEILVMDEPTSNLDRHSENKIMKNLLHNDKLTIIAIVHNPDLLDNFNRILYVNNEQIEDIVDRTTIDFNSWYKNSEIKVSNN